MIFAARMRKISKLLLSKQEKLLERMKLYYIKLAAKLVLKLAQKR